MSNGTDNSIAYRITVEFWSGDLRTTQNQHYLSVVLWLFSLFHSVLSTIYKSLTKVIINSTGERMCVLLYPALTSSSPAIFSHPSMPSWSVATGYLALGASLLLPSPKLLSQLTQQDDDAQQDGNQSPSTETRGGQERLALTHTDPAVALAWAHPQCQGAGPTQWWLPTIPNHDG